MIGAGAVVPPWRHAFEAARDPNAAANALFLRGDHLADASLAKLANMGQATIKGRASGAGTGVPVDLTRAQVSTILAQSVTKQVFTLLGNLYPNFGDDLLHH